MVEARTVTLDRTAENYLGYEALLTEQRGIRGESYREPMRSCGEGEMLSREQIIQSFVAKADAQYLEYCKIPLDDPNHSWAYDSAEYRATLKSNQEFFLSNDPKIVEFHRFPGMKGYSHDCPGAIYEID
jgi:hypothetical protein